MSEQESNANGVRVTNAEIYRLLLDTNARVASVDQTVRDVLKPGLESALEKARRLDQEKADAADLAKAQTRLERIELRMYAIVSGLVAAVVGGKGLGIL